MQNSLFEHRQENNLSKLRPLRPRQLEAIRGIREAIREGHKRIILQAPTGFGKTLTSAHIIANALLKGSRPLFTCPAISLVDQTLSAFTKEGIHDIGVMQAQHARTNRDAAVQIASVQTLIRREFPDVDFMLLDECFPAGTIISTPAGPIPIEKMRPNFGVNHAIGTGRVESVFRKRATKLIKVRLNNGSYFRCTPDHPVFTVSGWKKAGKLEVRAVLFDHKAVRMLREGVWSEVREEWGSRRDAGIRSGLSGASLLRELLREADGESNVSARSAGRGVAVASPDEAQASIPRRERKANAGDSKISAGDFRGGVAVRACGEDASASTLLSPSLQAGSSATSAEDLPGVGRRQSSIHAEERAGREEGCASPFVWVESVEVEELGSPELVYNLRVTGHPSYFANGVLVHNCHELFDGLNEKLEAEENKNKIVIGLSATPWARGMGLRWTKLVIAGTINDMIAEGHATPAVVYGPERDLDRGSVKVTRGEFEEASAAAAMSDKSIIGDVLKEWQEKSPREKTFAFCVNRDHAKAQMEAFQDAGIPFGYIDANVPQEERKRIFAKMKHGEIAGIASVGCLIRGVDEDVRCILDLQPTKSEMRHVQKWGRGVRCAEGKTALIGLDHAGNNAALGLFTDIFHDSLDVRKPGERGEAYKDDYKPAKPKKCGKCLNLIPPGARACPVCKERVPLNPGVTVKDGRLVEIGSGPKKDTKAQQDFYSGLLWIARRSNRKDGWAAYVFRDRWGEWPKNLRVRGKQPTEEVTKFVRDRQKEYLKSKQPTPEPTAEMTA